MEWSEETVGAPRIGRGQTVGVPSDQPIPGVGRLARLEGRIGFLDIVETVEGTLAAVPAYNLESLEDVHRYDQAAREAAARLTRRTTPPPAAAKMVGLQ